MMNTPQLEIIKMVAQFVTAVTVVLVSVLLPRHMDRRDGSRQPQLNPESQKVRRGDHVHTPLYLRLLGSTWFAPLLCVCGGVWGLSSELSNTGPITPVRVVLIAGDVSQFGIALAAYLFLVTGKLMGRLIDLYERRAGTAK